MFCWLQHGNPHQSLVMISRVQAHIGCIGYAPKACKNWREGLEEMKLNGPGG